MEDKEEKVIATEGNFGETVEVFEPTDKIVELVESVSFMVEVTLNLGSAEFVGQHTIFIDGKSIQFLDGVAKVSFDQVELLKKHGYIK